MNEPKSGKTGASTPKLLKAPATWCPRVQRDLSHEEHKACPYCFGEDAEVRSGELGSFCDFKPGKDPVNFGFPPN